MIIYGIKNCDTMKKAFDWLKANNFDYTFHDYKKDGIAAAKVKEWLEHFPVTTLVNTKGTTYKKLSEDEKAALNDLEKLVPLIIANTSLIKRPLLESNNWLIGFKEAEWEQELLYTLPRPKEHSYDST